MNNLAKDLEYLEVKNNLRQELMSWMAAQDDFLVEEGYMPLLKPKQHALDKNSVWITVPPEYVNSLEEKDYLLFHY